MEYAGPAGDALCEAHRRMLRCSDQGIIGAMEGWSNMGRE